MSVVEKYNNHDSDVSLGVAVGAVIMMFLLFLFFVVVFLVSYDGSLHS